MKREPLWTGALKRVKEEYSIPDVYFGHEAAFDRVLFLQLPPHNLDVREEDGKSVYYYKGTEISVPDDRKRYYLDTNPRGVIVAAGLFALEHLRTHGIDVGHVCTFLRLSLYRVPIAAEGTQLVTLTSCRSHDVQGSEDTARLCAEGKIRVVWKETPDWRGYMYETVPEFKDDPLANFIPALPPSSVKSTEDM